MKLTIELSSSVHAKLLEQAQSRGRRLPLHIADILKDHVARPPEVKFGKEALRDIAATALQAGISALGKKIGGGA